jgi:hypothetical protein
MSVNNETGARQFVASAEAMSSGRIKGTKIWQAVYTVFFVAFVGFAVLAMFGTSRGMHVHAPRYSGLIFMAVLLVAGVVMGGYLYWRSRQKYVLTINGDALTIAPRGDIYSLGDAQLGLWPNIGVALHLHSGVAASSWAAAIARSVRRHRSMLRLSSWSMPGYRRPISTSCFAWVAAPRRADPHRANRLGAFCSPIRRRSSTRVRSHLEKSNDW